MVFKMSYGITPPSPAAPSLAAPAKARPPSRSRKGSSSHAQAEALFDPTLARSGNTPASPLLTDAPDDGAAGPVLAEKDAETR